MYLHGNKIAEIGDDYMTIFDGGWQSNTTKSRLNALCDEFCVDGEGVFQKDFKWFVRKFVGQSSITGKVFNVDDFSNGYTLLNLNLKDVLSLNCYYLHLHSHYLMKIVLLIVVGVLLWNSDKAREFTSEQLNNASEFISPDKTNTFTIKF